MTDSAMYEMGLAMRRRQRWSFMYAMDAGAEKLPPAKSTMYTERAEGIDGVYHVCGVAWCEGTAVIDDGGGEAALYNLRALRGRQYILGSGLKRCHLRSGLKRRNRRDRRHI